MHALKNKVPNDTMSKKNSYIIGNYRPSLIYCLFPISLYSYSYITKQRLAGVDYGLFSYSYYANEQMRSGYYFIVAIASYLLSS